jgi:hypothetical protein
MYKNIVHKKLAFLIFTLLFVSTFFVFPVKKAKAAIVPAVQIYQCASGTPGRYDGALYVTDPCALFNLCKYTRYTGTLRITVNGSQWANTPINSCIKASTATFPFGLTGGTFAKNDIIEAVFEYKENDQCVLDNCGGCSAAGSTKTVRQQCIVDVFIPMAGLTYAGPIIDFNTIVNLIYSVMLPIGIILGGFNIAKSGYALMTSEGNPQKVMEAKEDLTSAIIGAVFVVLSVVILRVIIKALIG